MRVYVCNIRGPIGKTPDIAVEATVDGTTGTPNVVVTQSGEAEQPTIEMAFSGLKGEPAGFGNASAEITALAPDAKPTVEVSAGGPDSAKELSFSFGIPTGIADGSVSKSKLDSSLQGAVDKAHSAVQPAALEEEQQRATGAEKANDAAIKTEASRAQGAEQANASAISDEVTRAKAAEQANASAISAEITRAKGIESGLDGRVTEIEGIVPTQASADNQLADKAFVNSSVQTNTANPRGNWDNWAAVPTTAEYPADAYGGKTPTVNDYLVVQDASDYPVRRLSGTWRFKYSGTWAQNGKDGWQPEYQVNREPLTAAQVAALDSGMTSAQVAQINTNKTDIATLKTKNTEQDSEMQTIKADLSSVGEFASSHVSVLEEKVADIKKNAQSLESNIQNVGDKAAEALRVAEDAMPKRNLGALAQKDKVGAGDISTGAITDADISIDAAIDTGKIAGYVQTMDNFSQQLIELGQTIKGKIDKSELLDDVLTDEEAFLQWYFDTIGEGGVLSLENLSKLWQLDAQSGNTSDILSELQVMATADHGGFMSKEYAAKLDSLSSGQGGSGSIDEAAVNALIDAKLQKLFTVSGTTLTINLPS